MCVDSHINLRVVFVVVTTFYTLVNMRSIYFFRVALVIVICRPLRKGSRCIKKPERYVVIANHPAGWCGNPPVRWKSYWFRIENI